VILLQMIAKTVH